MPFLAVLRRSLSSVAGGAAKAPQRFPELPKIHTKYKPQVIEEAQNALTEYLHGTRSVPFTFAELIATNSRSSLCALVRKVPFSVPTFSRNFRKLLRYQPINEFEFFFESIGIDHRALPEFLRPNKFFFTQDPAVLSSACALHGFGFPWNRLGSLYRDEASIFDLGSDELARRLRRFKESCGSRNLAVVGVCLAFPLLLTAEPGDTSEAVFQDFNKLFGGFDGNAEAWYELCGKVKLFYDLGCERGAFEDLMLQSREALLQCPREVLARKIEYFTAFGVGAGEAGLLLLRRPELLGVDWETPVISVPKLLRHFGLDEEELQCVSQKHPHVVGRNEMANLPYAMRALDLNEWFIGEVKSSSPERLASCALTCREDRLDTEFAEALRSLEASRRPSYLKKKLEAVKRIGFGENRLAAKAVGELHGSGGELRRRFEFLLRAGLEYPMLCRLVRSAPKIFSQGSEILGAKLEFMRGQMGCSLDYLETFPTILCFDLARIEFRFRFYLWLRATGLCKKDYSVASLVATSEKAFVKRLFRLHPALPKQYLELFSNRRFAP